MRIGEIAVIGPKGPLQYEFLRSVCDSMEVNADAISFGRVFVNDHLMVHLYGIQLDGNAPPAAWDLVAGKLLGFVFLFSWGNDEELVGAQAALDALSERYDAPMIIAANYPHDQTPIPETINEEGIFVDKDGRLLFCDTHHPQSVRRVVSCLIDLAIERTP